jgi:hypothetical protein
MPRFMMFMYPQVPEEQYGPESATEADLTAMMAFNDEMTRAGVLLAGDGLHPASSGARVRVSAEGKRVVTDGPYLLARTGRAAEARQEFERAATLTRNDRERELLLDRARNVTT